MGKRQPVQGAPLTPNEIEILQLLADGHGTKQIARKTGRSSGCVMWHCHQINLRLGTNHRTHAVAICLREGIIRPPNHLKDLG